jgi:hypothetical protein
MALFCLIGWAGFLTAAPPASAQFQAWVMAKLPDRPWGLGIDSKGNIYACLRDHKWGPHAPGRPTQYPIRRAKMLVTFSLSG